MLKFLAVSVLSLLTSFADAQGPSPPASIPLPPLTGPHKVGITAFSILNPKTDRDIPVSIFYPTHPSVNEAIYPLAPAYNPPRSAYLEAAYGITPGFASLALSRAHANAPLHYPSSKPHSKPQQPPVLIFSPGYGGSKEDYTSTLSDIASHSYIVLAFSHPNDTSFIDYYPYSNVTAFATPDDLTTEGAPAAKIDLRVSDIRFVLDSLAKNKNNVLSHLNGWKKLCDKKHKGLDISNLGIFGHSLGGAASGTAILSAPSLFKCGINIDGSFWGPVATSGVKNPFLIMSSEDRDRVIDASWASFWKGSKAKGQKQGKGKDGIEIKVKGARHGGFPDFGYLYSILRTLGAIPEVPADLLFGTINSERLLSIEGAYVESFFGKCLKGGLGKLLKGESKKFPEVTFWKD